MSRNISIAGSSPNSVSFTLICFNIKVLLWLKSDALPTELYSQSRLLLAAGFSVRITSSLLLVANGATISFILRSFVKNPTSGPVEFILHRTRTITTHDRHSSISLSIKNLVKIFFVFILFIVIFFAPANFKNNFIFRWSIFNYFCISD